MKKSSQMSSPSYTSSTRGRGRGGGRGGKVITSTASTNNFSNFNENARVKREEEKKRLSDEFYPAKRGEKFTTFISDLLKTKAKLPSDKITEYIKYIDIFEQAFTHPTSNYHKNYEALEIIGDSILNFCIVNYIQERFPHLMSGDGNGVKTIARLKINLVSKKVFANFANELGFSEYIASDMLTRKDDMNSLLEDVFEAFNGALMQVAKACDPSSTKKGYLVGIGPQYRIVMYLLDSIDISLKYEDLYDAKTRFKQMSESKGIAGRVRFENDLNGENKIIFTAIISVNINGQDFEWSGKDFTKAGAEQIACELAITNIKKMDF